MDIRLQAKRRKHGNHYAMSVLRGGYQPGGLGGRPGVLRSLRRARAKYHGSGMGTVVLPSIPPGTGVGLATGGAPCVARFRSWRSWRPWDARGSVSGSPGFCRKWGSWPRPPPCFGGRWSSGVKLLVKETFKQRALDRESKKNRTTHQACHTTKCGFDIYYKHHISSYYISKKA